jgi:tripartite-type tricarboxylate transporter receptor subunit TctC
MQIDRRRALGGIGAVLAAGGRREAFAQNSYPARPIRIIAPSSAGGPYDIIPRFVADYISRKYGWAIAVENRPGASGILGVVAAKQARPDGYTLVIPSAATHGSEPAFNHTLPYDPYTDLAPIILLAKGALVLLVGKPMRVSSVADLLALIRSKPGVLKFSSAGHLTQQHLAVALMLQRSGLPQDACTHVPYRGLVEAVRGLLAGEVDFMIVSTGSVRGYLASGDLRALAITSPERSTHLPNVPTFAELGFPRSSPGARWPRRPGRRSRFSTAGTPSRTKRCATMRFARASRKSTTTSPGDPPRATPRSSGTISRPTGNSPTRPG